MDVEKRKAQMHSLAFGEAMAAAAEDYKKDMLAAERAAVSQPAHQQVDIDDLLDDPDLERLHAERLAALRQEAEKRAILQRKGHGSYEAIAEGEFLEACTKAERLVCHFYHPDFERCRVVDAHLAALAVKHFGTRFVKLSVLDAPFFVEKLQVRTLPCIIAFVGGVAVDRLVGFAELGGKDDFPTGKLEARLVKAGAIELPPQRTSGDSDDEREAYARRSVRGGFASGARQRGASDEDSDFE